MGFKEKAQATAVTALVVGGSVAGSPSHQAQLAHHQKVRQQQRQTAALNEASRGNARPSTGQEK